MIILCLIPVFISAQSFDNENNDIIPGFTSYKPVYFIFGSGTEYSDDLVKVGFSFKYDFLSEFKTGIYIAYAQTMFWDFWGESGPFKEINFSPELFLRFESGNNFISDVNIPLLDYIQGGWEHRSNGKDGEFSRGWDRIYGELQLKLGRTFYIKAAAKYFYYLDTDFLNGSLFSLSDNPDIENYTSNFEFRFTIGYKDMPIFFIPHKIVISAGPGGGKNQFDFEKGWQQADIYFGKLIGDVRAYVQVWNGYGQSVLDYNQSSFSAHFGIAIEL